MADDLSFDFSNRSVVVTGAAHGIGRELARFFATNGATVAAVDLEADDLRDDRDLSEVIVISGSVTDPDVASRAVGSLMQRTGAIHVLVNNAGALRDRMLWKMSDDDWRTVLDVHLTGTFNMTRAAVVPMRGAGYGRIINVTSYAGLHGNVGQANYSAAKAGIIGFTRTSAKELARFGITVNAISPNARTRMIESIPEPRRSQIAALAPIERFGEPEEMAPAVGFLASDAAAYITGVVLPVDGGLSI